MIQGHFHHPHWDSLAPFSAHDWMPHPDHDPGQDEGHLHEGGTVPLGEETACDGEATEGEDDTQCDATKGLTSNKFSKLEISTHLE